ncbi:MAG: lamin tail domain-containing protein [Myxococcales bacterium]|nr:lamin tail domain-containing protein [Myxococcales bacterium]
MDDRGLGAVGAWIIVVICYVTICAMSLGLVGCDAVPSRAGGAREEIRVQLGGGGSPLSLTGELLLRLSAPVDPARVVDGVVLLVPHELGDVCSVDLACSQWGGRCVSGVCQRDPVDDAFERDALRPPLSARRAAQVVPIDLSLAEAGSQLRVVPRRALAPRRAHTLLVSSALVGAEHAEVALRALVNTGDGSRARPTMTLLSPVAGSTELPRNLARVVVGFSRPVLGVPGRLWLRVGSGAAAGAAVRLDAQLDDARCADGRCVVLALTGALPSLAELSLEVRPGIYDASGRALFIEPPARMASGAGVDRAAPRLLGLRAFVADGCLVVRARSDEPADALLELPEWGSTRRASSVGLTSHELALRVAPGTRTAATLALRDMAGNVVVRTLSVVAPPAAPALVISEVLANPHGAEPAQELVELVNRGAAPLRLGGYRIDDGDDGEGARVLPDVELAPGQRALLVGASWRASSTRDPAPREGALLVRLDGPIGALGLANAGEPLVLRDAQGHIVSSYGGHHDTSKSALDGASVERVALDACDVAASWRINAQRTSTPGW